MTMLTTGLAAALALGQVGGFISRIGEAALERQLAQMEAAGEALTLEELVARRPAVPDDQNSALVILALEGELNPAVSNDWPTFPSGIAPSAADLDAARAIVRQHADLLERPDRIHDLPTGRYPFDLSHGAINVSFVYMPTFRAAAKLERVAAIVDIADGRTDDALRRCKIVLNLAGPLHEEPTVLTALMAHACDALALDMLQVALNAGPVDARRLSELEARLAERERVADFSWALRGERLSYRAIVEGTVHPDTPITFASPTVPSIPGAIGAGIRALNIAKGLELQGRLVDALDDPARLRAVAAQVSADVAQLPPRYILIKVLFPSLERAVALNMRSRGLLASARAALAAERYRLDRGDWPASLDVLVPEYLDAVPLDHFDGRPLRMRRTEEGIVIYTIGENNVDDGGDIFGQEDAQPTDWGFRLLDPDRRGVKIVDGEERAPAVD